MISCTELPDDPAALKAMLLEQAAMAERERALLKQRDAELAAELANRDAELARQQAKLAALTHQSEQLQIQLLKAEQELLKLQRWYYGRRADQLQHPDEVAQLVLEFAQTLESLPPAEVEDVEAVADDASPVDLSQVTLPAARRIRRGRRNLASFDQLPVVRREYDLAEDQKPCGCCGRMRRRIGQESSWQLEYVPGHFERIEQVRFKYACDHCDQQGLGAQIELAEKPPAPIDKGLPGPGLLAYVVSSKFASYLPLYRLEELFGRTGVEIGRATMSVWCRDVAELLRPLYRRMIQRVLASEVICTDDTPMPMLAPGHGKTKTARIWVYVGDEDHPYDVFDFTLGRGRDGPMRFLAGFGGTLVADAYGGYDGVVVGNGLCRAGCWAHARRKFIEAEKSQVQMAREAVDWIGRLYGIERQAAGLSPLQRLALRQGRSKPILEALHERLVLWKMQLLPKHPMAEAVGYCLNQWPELSVFADDGRVPLDNNISEREMKRVVLNRKNSLFVGNERGGATAGILASFTSTCRRHEIDPQRYLTHLLTNLPATPMSELDQWLPDQWKQKHNQPMPVVKV